MQRWVHFNSANKKKTKNVKTDVVLLSSFFMQWKDFYIFFYYFFFLNMEMKSGI